MSRSKLKGTFNMNFIKAAIAVYLACSSWKVTPPSVCINELWDCTQHESIDVCQEKILDKYEPK